MSLMDAMLLEGYRDPKEVYIALRTDGLKGSGTIDDPFDGGTRFDSPLTSSLTCSRNDFIAGTFLPHVGDRIFSFELKSGNDPDPSKNPTGPITYAAHWDLRGVHGGK